MRIDAPIWKLRQQERRRATIVVESTMCDGMLNLMYARRDGTPPTPSAFAPSVVCPPLRTIVKSSSGPGSELFVQAASMSWGRPGTGAAAVSSDARSRSETGPIRLRRPDANVHANAASNAKPNAKPRPFFTRVKTESVEMGMRSVSSSRFRREGFRSKESIGTKQRRQDDRRRVGVDRVDVVRLDRHRRFQTVERIRLRDGRDENRAVEMRDHAVDRALRVALRQRIEPNDGAVSSVSPCDASMRYDSWPIGGRPITVVSTSTPKIVVSASKMACCGQSSGQDFPASRFSAHAAIVVAAIAARRNVRVFLRNTVNLFLALGDAKRKTCGSIKSAPGHRRSSECGVQCFRQELIERPSRLATVARDADNQHMGRKFFENLAAHAAWRGGFFGLSGDQIVSKLRLPRATAARHGAPLSANAGGKAAFSTLHPSLTLPSDDSSAAPTRKFE